MNTDPKHWQEQPIILRLKCETNLIFFSCCLNKSTVCAEKDLAPDSHGTRAVDPHSFFADPDPAIILNADPDPAIILNADPDPAA